MFLLGMVIQIHNLFINDTFQICKFRFDQCQILCTSMEYMAKSELAYFLLLFHSEMIVIIA